MVGLSEQIKIMENARALYAAAPSHADVLQVPATDTVCVVYAIRRAAIAADDTSLDCMRIFANAADTDNIVFFNAEHSTEEVLVAFDQAISELKAKVVTDERLLQVS